MPKVTFSPDNKGGEFEPGTNLLEASKRLQIELDHECGGFASCSTCRVVVEQGAENLSEIEFEEEDMMDLAQLTPPYRLGCQAKLKGDVVVRIPRSGDDQPGGAAENLSASGSRS